jgi:hypothetical protein
MKHRYEKYKGQQTNKEPCPFCQEMVDTNDLFHHMAVQHTERLELFVLMFRSFQDNIEEIVCDMEGELDKIKEIRWWNS